MVQEHTAAEAADLEAALRKTEEALRESEERYHLLYDTMLQGVVYQDADGTVIAMNPAAERILGKTAAEFLGETSQSTEHHCIHEDGSPFPGDEHPAMVALRVGCTVPDVVMGVYNPRQRCHRWIDITAVPLIQSCEEKPYQVYTLFADVTAHKAAQAERERLLGLGERRAAELEATIGAVGDGFLIYHGLEGREVRMNGAAERLLGVTEREYAAMSPREREQAVHIETSDGEPVPAAETAAARALRGETVVGLRETIRRRDGTTVELLASAAPIRDQEGHVLGAVRTLADITPIIRLERQREDILRAVSHDLESPLASIEGEAQTVERRPVAAAPAPASQEVRVRVRGGYAPDVIVVRAGRPVRVDFFREEDTPCSEQVLFPDLGQSARLTPFHDTVVQVTPPAPGEYGFQCGMGMLRGRPIAE